MIHDNYQLPCAFLWGFFLNRYHPRLDTIMGILAVSLVWDGLTARRSPSISCLHDTRALRRAFPQRQTQDVATKRRLLLIYCCVSLDCTVQDSCRGITTCCAAPCICSDWKKKQNKENPDLHIKRSRHTLEKHAHRKLCNVAGGGENS